MEFVCLMVATLLYWYGAQLSAATYMVATSNKTTAYWIRAWSVIVFIIASLVIYFGVL